MKEFKEKSVIMEETQIKRALNRIVHEILEKNKTFENIIVLGIRTRGVPLAERIVKIIKDNYSIELPIGILDINLYRDDLTTLSDQPIIHQTMIPKSITNKIVILVDDVLYTGRTIRAALDSTIALGRPLSIQLVVLIDRGHRELPIRADYVGKNVPTSKKEKIDVTLKEIDKIDQVIIKEEI